MSTTTTGKCCIPGCNIPHPRLELSFEEFPADPSLRKTWLKRIGSVGMFTQSFLNTVDARVCSFHFKEEDYRHSVIKEGNSGHLFTKKELTSNAVPSVFPWLPSWDRVVSLHGLDQWLRKDGLFYCSLCDFLTSTSNRLELHMIRHQSNSIFTCSLCSFSVPNRALIAGHLRVDHHRKDDSSCGCRSCDGSAEAVNAFFCNLCEYRTTDRPRWNNHLKGHRNSYKYKCNKCRFCSPHPDSMERHARLDHHRHNDPECSCRKCDASYAREKSKREASELDHYDEPGPSHKRRKVGEESGSSAGSIHSSLTSMKEETIQADPADVVVNGLMGEEADYQKKLSSVDEEIQAGYRLMDKIREEERTSRMEPLRRRIERFEEEERLRLAEVSDLTARREALRQRLSTLNSQKLRLEISVRSLELKAGQVDPRELHHQRSDLRALEKDLEAMQHEERELKRALDHNEMAVTTLGKMLICARAELSDAATAPTDPSDQMRRLWAAQHERIQLRTILSEGLCAVNYKLGLASVQQQRFLLLSQLDRFAT